MHQGSSLINCLLEVIQKAFKSPIEKVRVGAYENWKELIDNFANELGRAFLRFDFFFLSYLYQKAYFLFISDILSNVKRLTLLLQPLRLNNGHSESILKVKMQTWWHLIVCLGPKLQPNIDLVLSFLFSSHR